MVLSSDRTEAIYQGGVRYIVVRTDDGLKLQLPASNFRRFVGLNGINGRFSVRIDEQNKIIDLTVV